MTTSTPEPHEPRPPQPSLVSSGDAALLARAEKAEATVARVESLLNAPRFVDETIVDLADLRAVLVLDPDEAETVSRAFGPDDLGGEEIRRWAEEARERQREWDDGR